jgi:hypothetical protein
MTNAPGHDIKALLAATCLVRPGTSGHAGMSQPTLSGLSSRHSAMNAQNESSSTT